ncbi:MAG: DNA adenine methylase, partial [Clostridia bacterium]|nr:DNA adenine methylase [Clostridia bacterium]
MKTFLNYQGNKNRLLDFIDKYMPDYFQPNKKLLDIFSGGGSVSNHYYNKIGMLSNDAEIYSFHLANAIYSQGKKCFNEKWESK